MRDPLTAINVDTTTASLDRDGYAILPGLLSAEDCAALAAFYDAPDVAYRTTVVMARHGYGRGEYRYFARPLPNMVQALREGLYPALAGIANQWAARLGEAAPWPLQHHELSARCAAAGQTRPTPLLLRYGPGDYNRLHQDLYGALAFPLQVVVLLDQPGRDFDGGELVLVEGRARMQSRPMVLRLDQGDAAIIPVRDRPITSARGWTRATMRHGVNAIHRGNRRTLGIIFHDAA
jgi:uncharacterized protein